MPKVSRPPISGIQIVDHGLDAISRQHVGTGKARRAGADDGRALAGIHHVGKIRPPALLEGFVGDVLLHRADGDGAEAIIQRARAFAQSILWADPAADLG